MVQAMERTKMPENVIVKATRFVFGDVLFDVVRFPIWWYTTGTANAARFTWQEFLSVLDRLSIPILIRNLFKPMYGDYSKSGRAISFFVRIIVFVFRFIGMLIWSVVLFAAFIIWLGVIPAVVFEIVRQFIS